MLLKNLVVKSVHVNRILNKSLKIKIQVTNNNGLTYDLQYPYMTNFSDADWERSAHDETTRRLMALCDACDMDYAQITDFHELIGRTINELEVNIDK